MGDLRITRLESGLTVAIECVPDTHSVAAGVWVSVGSRDERDEQAGLSHFLEHLLFKGTTTRSAQQISRSVDRVGGDFNAFTSKEYTAYYCRLPARELELAVGLLGEVLTTPLLRPDDVESERQVILEELAMDDDAPDDVAHRRFSLALFPGHPLGRNPGGTRESVKAIRRDDIVEFFEQHYVAGDMVVSLVGPVDHDRALAEIESAFAGVRRGSAPVRRDPPTVGGRGIDLDDDAEQLHIVMGGAGLARTDPDREALDVVNHALGGGLSSRLFESIREQRGLVYTVFSGVSSYSDAGAYQLYAGTSPEHGDEVIGLMHHELRTLVDGGLDDDELDVAVGYLTGSFELGLEDNGARMSRNGGLLATVGAVRPIGEQIERWRAVDHAAVRRVIDRVFAADPLLVTVGPR